jgi:lipopolysaccharide transport system ATP-binding protein
MNSIVRVEHLSKQYRLGVREAAYDTLRESIVRAVRAPMNLLRRNGEAKNSTIWALEEISFDVRVGEIIGIIGHNGAGKSTLLKVLSRVTEPTRGRVELFGRVGSLLEVGTGFHPELTGRENIFLNGAILGMKRSEIWKKFDDMVQFAEVERFIDTPVKRYSSGMYLRLAFAVAAHLEPEILIIDEVLAVGDAAFQKRCLGKIGEVARGGRTVLFVSHNMAAIEGLCSRALLLESGRIVTSGPPGTVIERYLSSVQKSQTTTLSQRQDRQGNGRVRLLEVVFQAANGNTVDVLQSGQQVEIVVGYASEAETVNNVALSIGIYSLAGHCMAVLNNEMVGNDFASAPRFGYFCCQVGSLPLAGGQYYLNLYCEVNGILADWVQQAMVFTVEAGDFFGTGRLPPASHGGFLIPHHWLLTGKD